MIKEQSGRKQEYMFTRTVECLVKMLGREGAIKKVEWSSVNFEDVSHFQRIARIGWRGDWLWVEDFPRSHSFGPSPRNPRRSARKARHTWKLHKSNNLHVNVQRHCSGKEGNEHSCAITSRKIKEYALKFNEEKRASGIKDMLPNMVANWIFVLHRWWRISRTQDTKYSEEYVRWAVGYWRGKIIETQSTSIGNIATLTCCSRSSHKVVWKSRETSPSRHESARKAPREVQIKQEDLKSLVDIPRLPQASKNRMLQNLKAFNSMPFVSKIEYLRTTAKFYHPVEKGIHFFTTTLEDDGWRKRISICTEYTAPRNREDSRPYALIDANQEIGPVLNIGIATVMDVLSIEVQVSSLSTPRIIRMDFDKSWSRKICERNSPSQL